MSNCREGQRKIIRYFHHVEGVDRSELNQCDLVNGT